MCTVSWFATRSGYELFFNRDENRQRAIATAPVKRASNACDFLSPTDASLDLHFIHRGFPYLLSFDA